MHRHNLPRPILMFVVLDPVLDPVLTLQVSSKQPQLPVTTTTLCHAMNRVCCECQARSTRRRCFVRLRGLGMAFLPSAANVLAGQVAKPGRECSLAPSITNRQAPKNGWCSSQRLLVLVMRGAGREATL